MVKTNYLSDYQIFDKKHGCASKHPRLKDLLLSEHMMPHNLLFQVSAAFWFETSTGAADGVATSLWNGVDDAAHNVLGEAKFVFDVGFAEPSAALLKCVVPIITPIGADLHVALCTFTQVANYTTQCIVRISNGAGVAQGNINGWALFIGKRAHWKYNIAGGFSGKIFDGDADPALYGTDNLQTWPLIGGEQED